MAFTSKNLFKLASFSLIATLVPFSLVATTYQWTGASGATWATGSNWNPGTGYPSTSSDTANFSETSLSTISVNLNTSETVNAVEFTTAFPNLTTYTITSSGTTLTLAPNGSTPPTITGNAATNTISPSLTLGGSLTINTPSTGNTILSGTITDGGSGYGVTLSGSGTTTLSGLNNTYSGATSISSGSTLQAGSVSSLATGSAFTVNGTLNLNGFFNTILSLSGSGTVNSTSAATLTVSNGGTFSGGIIGSVGLALTGGTLNLNTTTSQNTYTGPTTLSNNSILTDGAVNSFSPNSAVTLGGTSTLQVGHSETIYSLTGGSSTSINLASGATLTISEGGTSQGTISGAGNLALTGGDLLVDTSLTYTGNTTISEGSSLVLRSNAAIYASGASSTITTVNGIFDISDSTQASQTIASLQGSSTSGSIVLGNNELILSYDATGTFAGTISGNGAFTYDPTSALTLTLSGNNSYTGATTVGTDGTLAAGSTDAFAQSSDFTVDGTLDLTSFNNTVNTLTGTGTVTSSAPTGSGGVLSIIDAGPFSGNITDSVGISVASGTLTLSGITIDYTGTTTLTNSSILQDGATGKLSSSSALVLQDSAQLNMGFNETVASLSGSSGTIATLALNTTLIITNGGSQTFAGQIQGSGALTLTAGTLTLSGNNTFTGLTTISSGTLALTGVGQLAGNVSVSGTFDIEDINSSATIANLSGSGTVLLGTKTLIVTTSAPSTFSGSIQGDGGDLTLQGNSTLTLSGTNNTYTGSTSIASGATLEAGIANSLAPGSAFTVNGTLALQNFSNIIDSLSGTGSVTSTGSTLFISNGGTYSGSMTGALSLTLLDEIFNVESPLAYTGNTTISGGSLVLSGAGELYTAGVSGTTTTVNGTFDISNSTSSQTIGTLSGSGSILLGDNILTLNPDASSTFSGVISGAGGSFIYDPASSLTLTLSGNSSYTGPTNIGSDGTLLAGSNTAFASSSDFTVDGTLNLSTFNNSVNTLEGAGTITGSGAVLTVRNGGTFSGQVINSVGLSLTSETLTLSGTNTYSGPTTIASLATLEAGSTSAFSGSSAYNVLGTLSLNSLSNSILSLSGSGTVNTSTSAILTVSNGGSFSGTITGSGALTLTAGTLTLSGNNTFTGLTTISAGTLALTGAGQLAGNVNVSGTFDIEDINSSATIANLSGSGLGTVLLGTKTLIVTTSAPSTFSGSIQGDGGDLTLQGNSTLTLSGTNNTYTGSTSIASGATLEAGIANSLAPGSAFTVNGTLALQNFSNIIDSLSGTGSVTSTGSTLFISNGGTYSGSMTGALSLTLLDEIFNVESPLAYTGNTTISGGSLVLSGAGELYTAGVSGTTTTVNGTFDISNSTSSQTIGTLSGSGSILLGDNILTLNPDASSTFSGVISGAGGSFIYDPASSLTLTLSGNSSYTGPTNIGSDGTLLAGSNTAFASSSDFTVDGTLNLSTFNNSVNTLEGAGTITGSGAVLTVRNGGTFSGQVINSVGLSLTSETLTLSGTNTYSGPTTIASLATLEAGSTSAFSGSSAYNVLGTLSLNSLSNSILSLSGSGTVNTSTSAILTVSNGGSFSGGITGSGGLTLTGGTLNLSTATSQNTYTGATTLSGTSILQAGAVNAFSPNSDYTLSGSATLDLNGYNNIIKSLASASSSSKVTLGPSILTINGGSTTTFAGSITNEPCGGITISGGTDLTLSNSSNNYCGPTLIENGSLTITANGALSPNTDVTISVLGELSFVSPATANSARSISNSGTLNTQEPISLSTSYSQNIAGNLNLSFNTANPTGQILATTGLSLLGNLDVTNTGTAPTSGFYTLLSTTSKRLRGKFFTPTTSGFTSTPEFAYYSKELVMFFADCSDYWSYAGNGNWNDSANWGGGAGCVPGINGNVNDVATFESLSPSAIQVTLANSGGTAPQPITLYQLNLNSSATAYTIVQFSADSTITFDLNGAPTEDIIPQINVEAGSHIINAPLILGTSTELVLSDGTQLTFNSNTSITSGSTEIFNVREANDASLENGLLINNSTLSPYGLSITSATFQNNSIVSPLNNLTIAGDEELTAAVTNSGVTAQMGPTEASATLQIGGEGTTSVTNSGIAASFGPTGTSGILQIGGTGTTTVVNNGTSATFGPTGVGGTLTLQGSGLIAVTNSGSGVKFGATGTGGNVTMSSGTFTNSSGALLTAGSGGTLTINGGSVTNDVTSTVGSSTQNIVLTSGTLNTSGDVEALNFTQGGSSTLQLNLTSVPTITGRVAATGTATVGSILSIDALPGSITTGQSVDLIKAQKGVSGTYSTVNYLNFPVGMIPDVVYTTNAVQLVTSETVTSNASGSFTELSFVSINEENIMIQREMNVLHHRIRQRKTSETALSSRVSSENNLLAMADRSQHLDPLISYQENTRREQHFLAENIIEEAPNPSRFYFGPTDSFGTFNTKSTSQTGFGFNSVGVFTGIDHAFDDYGLGFVSEYLGTKATVHQSSGNFHMDQVQASGYATWIPSSIEPLSIDAIAGYGYQWLNIHRKAGSSQTAVTAKGNTQAMVVDGLLGTEYMFSHQQFVAMPKNLLMTPFLNLQYMWSRIGEYDEYSGGIYALHFDSQKAQSLKSSLGTRLEYLVERQNFTFKPEFDLGWQFEYLDHKRTIGISTLNLQQSQSISNQVYGAGRSTLLLGVDFLFTVYKSFELEMSYDFQWNSLYTNNTFYLGIGGNF